MLSQTAQEQGRRTRACERHTSWTNSLHVFIFWSCQNVFVIVFSILLLVHVLFVRQEHFFFFFFEALLGTNPTSISRSGHCGPAVWVEQSGNWNALWESCITLADAFRFPAFQLYDRLNECTESVTTLSNQTLSLSCVRRVRDVCKGSPVWTGV